MPMSLLVTGWQLPIDWQRRPSSELLGEPPLRYLTRLRVNVAAKRLRSSDAKSGVVCGRRLRVDGRIRQGLWASHGLTPGHYRKSLVPDDLEERPQRGDDSPAPSCLL
jgi:hypothetical protein